MIGDEDDPPYWSGPWEEVPTWERRIILAVMGVYVLALTSFLVTMIFLLGGPW